jgi:sec-independent protein translocase protein TatA
LIILVVLVVLFGAKKMPDAARGLGQSLRIFKAEIATTRDERPATDPDAPGAGTSAPAAGPSAPVDGPPDPAAPTRPRSGHRDDRGAQDGR